MCEVTENLLQHVQTCPNHLPKGIQTHTARQNRLVWLLCYQVRKMRISHVFSINQSTTMLHRHRIRLGLPSDSMLHNWPLSTCRWTSNWSLRANCALHKQSPQLPYINYHHHRIPLFWNHIRRVGLKVLLKTKGADPLSAQKRRALKWVSRPISWDVNTKSTKHVSSQCAKETWTWRYFGYLQIPDLYIYISKHRIFIFDTTSPTVVPP